MRCLLSVILFLSCAMNAAADTFLYISMAPEQKIKIFRLDPRDKDVLIPVDLVSVDGTPGSLAVSPDRKFLFASLRTSSSLASFSLDAATGKIKHISTATLPKDENAAFVGTDRTGRWLISASYAAGKVVVHKLGADGTIQTPPVETVVTTKTAHAFTTDAKNQFVFVPHVAPNAVYQFRLDAATGKLTENGKAPGGSDKSGPRHIAFHPSGEWAFTSDETGSSITSYAFDASTGGLKPLQTLSTLPADFKGKNTTAEVKVHPSGKFVWVSNRGHDSLAGFAIDKAGKLTSLGQTGTEKTPRSFEIDPDGRYLWGAGEGTGMLASYEVDPASGKLTRGGTYNIGKSLTWVMAVKVAGK